MRPFRVSVSIHHWYGVSRRAAVDPFHKFLLYLFLVVLGGWAGVPAEHSADVLLCLARPVCAAGRRLRGPRKVPKRIRHAVALRSRSFAAVARL